MARPKKDIVDYFPHQCAQGKTMYILEQKFGNDGYAFWFKLLELLGLKGGHYLDLKTPMEMEFLQAKTHLSEEITAQILTLLASLEAIDAELWSQKIVWCQNFVDGISDVYVNRRVETPQRPSFYTRKLTQDNITTPKSTQSKVKESKVEETKVNGAAVEKFDIQQSEKFLEQMIIQEMMKIWMKHNPSYQENELDDFPALLQIAYKIAKAKNYAKHEVVNGRLEDVCVSWEKIVVFIKNDKFYRKLQLQRIEAQWSGLYQTMCAEKSPLQDKNIITDPSKVKINLK